MVDVARVRENNHPVALIPASPESDDLVEYKRWSQDIVAVMVNVVRDVTALTAVPLAGPTLVIASGALAATATFHLVDTEGAASTDDLATINGGTTGQRLVLTAASDARTIVLKDGTGNLALAGDFSLTHTEDTIELIAVGNNWFELSRSDNGT